MTMTMDELMKVLDMQEDILQFTHFTNADAWELGTMILMEARRRGAQVGIMIRRSNGEVVFQYCDNGITPHNVELMRRKSNSVLLTERSSLQLYMAATNAPESVKQMVLDPKEYAMLGGDFPVPLIPTMPTLSPSCRPKEASSKISLSPNSLLMCSMLMIFICTVLQRSG